MGRTRTGKTTVAKVLADPFYVPPEAKLHSATKEVTIHPIAAIMNEENHVYCFNVVDTPGLFDKVKGNNIALSNERIKAAIDECINKDVTNMHLFAFVISFLGHVNVEDIDSIEFVIKYYPNLRPYICLLVTHSEESLPDQRSNKMLEFFQSKEVIQRGFKEFFKDRIFYMGSLRPELRTHPNYKSAEFQIENILDMRQTFLNHVTRLDVKNTFNIHRVKKESSGCILL
ncbi:hypothetical protein I4U23_012639 [Adineta vaga]|nr:hypothetical protein I4U23_012639 [Adineta vaga]